MFDALKARLEAAGYPPDVSGLDKMCRTGVQSFYLPCTNRTSPESAFFDAYGLDRLRDFERYALDPLSYGAVTEPEPRTRPGTYLMTANVGEQTSAARQDRVIAEVYAEYGQMVSGRHTAILSAANRLAAVANDAEVIKGFLCDIFQADYEREREIDDVIDKLQREGRVQICP